MLSLDAASQQAIYTIRRPISARAIREGRSDQFYIFKVKKGTLCLEHSGAGNAHDLFQKLACATDDIRVAIARFQVGCGVSKYLKFFGVYYDPVGMLEGDAGRSVSQNRVGAKDQAFKALGVPLLTYAAYGPQDLKVNVFSDHVFRFGKLSGSASGEIGDSGDGGGSGSVRARGQLIEQFIFRRRQPKAQNAPHTTPSILLPEDNNTEDALARQLHRQPRRQFPAPKGGEFYKNISCDHVVLMIDVSAPMMTTVRTPNHPDSAAKLSMVKSDLLQVGRTLGGLIDVVWFHGRGFGTWQLDPDSWGDPSPGKDIFLNFWHFIDSLETIDVESDSMEGAGAGGGGGGRGGSAASYSDASFAEALQYAMTKRGVASVHVVVDGSHAFGNLLTVEVSKELERHRGDASYRCPPVNIVALDPPHLRPKGKSPDAAGDEDELVGAGSGAGASAGAGAGAGAYAGETGAPAQEDGEHNPCGFLRNVCVYTQGDYLEIGGFEKPTWWEGARSRLLENMKPYLPNFLRTTR